MTSKQTRRPLTDREKTDIALMQFATLKRTGSWPKLEDLAREFKRSPSVISRAFKMAIYEGLVEVKEVSRPLKPPQRLSSLEAQLMERFKELRGAIVIRGGSAVARPEIQLGLPDDELHASLGQAMAQYLTSASVFRDADVIAVGSGRGVQYTIEAAGKVFPLPFRVDVTLMSLTGSVYSRSTQKRFWLDADTHAALLALCFDREVRLNLIRYPLTYPSNSKDGSAQHSAKEIRERTSLGSKQWAASCPTHALVGVGLLAPNHRFYEEAMAKPEEQEPLLASIHVRLVELVKLCEKQASAWENAAQVADMSNHLIYIPAGQKTESDRRKQKESDKAQREIIRLIQEINEAMITIQSEQLSQIKNLILVAGTEKKFRAIKELLTNPKYHVRYLCTDEAAAVRILDTT
jgi:DNA-binding transcriptional regulator LsrR (DeoR family)